MKSDETSWNNETLIVDVLVVVVVVVAVVVEGGRGPPAGSIWKKGTRRVRGTTDMSEIHPQPMRARVFFFFE